MTKSTEPDAGQGVGAEPLVRCYRITFDPMQKGGMQTCMPRQCLCCGTPVSGGGGGGEHLCDSCHEMMRKRVLSRFFRIALEYGDDVESGLSTIIDALRGYEEEHVRT